MKNKPFQFTLWVRGREMSVSGYFQPPEPGAGIMHEWFEVACMHPVGDAFTDINDESYTPDEWREIETAAFDSRPFSDHDNLVYEWREMYESYPTIRTRG